MQYTGHLEPEAEDCKLLTAVIAAFGNANLRCQSSFYTRDICYNIRVLRCLRFALPNAAIMYIHEDIMFFRDRNKTIKSVTDLSRTS